MTLHLGNVPAGATLYIPFETVQATGAGITISGLAVTDIEIYKNGSTTQRASDNGYALLDTDGTDFDGVTGLHGFSIDLSDSSDSGFYAAGSFYWVVVNAVTVAGVSVTPLVATFRVVAAENTAGTPVADAVRISGSTTAADNAEIVFDTDFAANYNTTADKWNASVTHVAGAAVSTSSAQLGVNVVNAAGTAWNSGAIGAGTLAGDTITAAKIAADAIGASELATDAVTEIVSAVWAAAARTLTALDEGTTALDLDGTIRAAIGLASASLDAQLSAIDDFLDTEIAAIKAKTDLIPASPAAAGDIPTANQNADALLDRSAGIETGLTPRQLWRLVGAVLAGKVSGAGTGTEVFRNAVADAKARVTATVDSDGNRTAITTDLT